MISLEMVYTRDGTLALLKQNDCRGRLAGWSNQPKHGSNCGCHGTKITWTVQAVHWIQPGEQEWVWHRCPTRFQADV